MAAAAAAARPGGGAAAGCAAGQAPADLLPACCPCMMLQHASQALMPAAGGTAGPLQCSTLSTGIPLCAARPPPAACPQAAPPGGARGLDHRPPAPRPQRHHQGLLGLPEGGSGERNVGEQTSCDALRRPLRLAAGACAGGPLGVPHAERCRRCARPDVFVLRCRAWAACMAGSAAAAAMASSTAWPSGPLPWTRWTAPAFGTTSASTSQAVPTATATPSWAPWPAG